MHGDVLGIFRGVTANLRIVSIRYVGKFMVCKINNGSPPTYRIRYVGKIYGEAGFGVTIFMSALGARADVI